MISRGLESQRAVAVPLAQTVPHCGRIYRRRCAAEQYETWSSTNCSTSGQGMFGRATNSDVRPWMQAHTCSAVDTSSSSDVTCMSPASATARARYDVRERLAGQQVVPVIRCGVGRTHEHDPVVLRVLDPEPHVGAAAGSHRLQGTLDPGAGRLDHIVKALELPSAYLEQQVLLVGEVAVDRKGCHPGGGGDRSDRQRGFRSGLEEQLLGRLEDVDAEQVPLTLAGTLPGDVLHQGAPMSRRHTGCCGPSRTSGISGLLRVRLRSLTPGGA